MANATAPEIQYVSNEDGEPTAVIVPIDIWREISSERETVFILRSETMRRRLAEALKRDGGIPVEEAFEKLGI
jgi:PHD/YefM family antitoxin component YafN of YafNO toxin-antitoxin module